jgi:hypothetical protein
MAKTKIIKKVKKKTIDKVEKELDIVPIELGESPSQVDKTYHVIMSFNDIIHEFDTDDLVESINAVKPTFLKTKVIFKFIRVSDLKECDRQLFVRGGRMIFRNALSLKIFINTLIFK